MEKNVSFMDVVKGIFKFSSDIQCEVRSKILGNSLNVQTEMLSAIYSGDFSYFQV